MSKYVKKGYMEMRKWIYLEPPRRIHWVHQVALFYTTIGEREEENNGNVGNQSGNDGNGGNQVGINGNAGNQCRNDGNVGNQGGNNGDVGNQGGNPVNIGGNAMKQGRNVEYRSGNAGNWGWDWGDSWWESSHRSGMDE